MAVQDDKREIEMRLVFDLLPGESRGGTDAFLVVVNDRIPFELKSSTNNSFSTVRDLGPDHFVKWRLGKHWLLGRYDPAGKTLLYTYYATPAKMEPWVSKMEEYIRADVQLAKLAPERLTMDDLHEIVGAKTTYSLADARKLHKRQYTSAEYKASMDGKDHYSPARMLVILRDRCRYVINRGSTLNNSHIAESYFVNQDCEIIKEDHAAQLRKFVLTAIK